MKLFSLILFITIFSTNSRADEFNYKMLTTNGSYTNRDLVVKIVSPVKGKISFDFVYLDSAYETKNYTYKRVQNTLYLERVDVQGSASRHQKPYRVSGSVSGLKPGRYKFILRRKNLDGKFIEIIDKDIDI